MDYVDAPVDFDDQDLSDVDDLINDVTLGTAAQGILRTMCKKTRRESCSHSNVKAELCSS